MDLDEVESLDGANDAGYLAVLVQTLGRLSNALVAMKAVQYCRIKPAVFAAFLSSSGSLANLEDDDHRSVRSNFALGAKEYLSQYLPEVALETIPRGPLDIQRLSSEWGVLRYAASLCSAPSTILTIDADGYCLGVRRVPLKGRGGGGSVVESLIEPFLVLTRSVPIIICSFVGHGKGHLFCRGDRVLELSRSGWKRGSLLQLRRHIGETCRRASVDKQIISALARVAMELIERGSGATFIIGDTDEVLKNSEPMTPSGLNIPVNVTVRSLPILEMCSYAEQDGAIILDSIGTIRAIGRNLLAPLELSSSAGDYGHTRHASAARMTATTNSVALVVSKEFGTITFYLKGQPVHRW